MNDAPRVAAWESIGIALCGVAFVLLRLPLYTRPGILLGWHSDAALLGLMARAIARGDVPLLFWGCDYLWPLTSLFAAAVGRVIGNVGPLALRLGTGIEVFAALAFYYAALRRAVGPRGAMLATLWLSAGPAFLFKLTYAPLSAEQYFFTGSVVLWYATRTRFTRLHQWLVLGILAGLGWWIHRGVMFVALPAIVIIFIYDRELLRLVDLIIGTLALIAGFVLGYLPVVFGRLEIDQRLYAPVTPAWHVSFVWERIVDIVTHDLWLLLGAENLAIGAALVLLLALAARHFEIRRETMLAAGVVCTAFAFWIVSTLAYRGAVRYVMVVLPILYAFAGAEVVRVWDQKGRFARVTSLIIVAIVTITLFAGRYIDAREVAAAHREPFENWGGFDPRPSLRVLAASHYTVCYADVWVAHKLEWLSDPTVPIIPYRSVNRRMVESLRLAALPGRKCFIDKQGTVRELTPAEAAQFRLDTLRLVRGTVVISSPKPAGHSHS